MYGTNTYTRLDVDYPGEASHARSPDANLSNFNTQLSRTIIHDENRYSDSAIRPKAGGKYEYVHDTPTPANASTALVTAHTPYTESDLDDTGRVLASAPRVNVSPPEAVRPVPTQAPRPNLAPESALLPTPPPPVTVHPPKPTVISRPQAVQTDESTTNHRKLVHDAHVRIRTKKEYYRKCKRRNRLFIFVAVIAAFILFAIVRRILYPK